GSGQGGSGGVRVEAGGREGVVTLSVVDFGRGIAEEDQARVFEKFRTVRRSPTDDPGGDTGLGLPFCRLAVERMGGRMSLASSPDAGTAFTVELPAHAAPCAPPSVDARAPGRHAACARGTRLLPAPTGELRAPSHAHLARVP